MSHGDYSDVIAAADAMLEHYNLDYERHPDKWNVVTSIGWLGAQDTSHLALVNVLRNDSSGAQSVRRSALIGARIGEEEFDVNVLTPASGKTIASINPEPRFISLGPETVRHAISEAFYLTKFDDGDEEVREIFSQIVEIGIPNDSTDHSRPCEIDGRRLARVINELNARIMPREHALMDAELQTFADDYYVYIQRIHNMQPEVPPRHADYLPPLAIEIDSPIGYIGVTLKSSDDPSPHSFVHNPLETGARKLTTPSAIAMYAIAAMTPPENSA